MSAKVILEFNIDDDSNDVLAEIREAISLLPGISFERTWVQLVIDGIASDVLFSEDDKNLDECELSSWRTREEWNEAYEILQRHVDSAAREIKEKSQPQP